MRFLVCLRIYMCVYAYICISMSVYLYVFIYLIWRCICPGCEVIGLLVAHFPWFETSNLFGSVSYHVKSLTWLWMYITRFEISDLLVGIYLRLWGLWFVCRSWCQVSVLILNVFPACNVSNLFVVSCRKSSGLWSLFGCISHMSSLICMWASDLFVWVYQGCELYSVCCYMSKFVRYDMFVSKNVFLCNLRVFVPDGEFF